jgi:vacuolar-type H+-ATPase subunit I/STV1
VSDKDIMEFDVDPSSMPVNEADPEDSEDLVVPSDWDPEIEVYTEEDEAEKVPDELKKRFDTLEQELKASRQDADPGSKIDRAFEKLADRLESIQGTPQQKQEQLENIEEFKKKLGDSFYNDPVKSLDTYFERMVKENIAPAYQNMANQLQATTAELSKERAVKTETGKLVLDKYGSEVEKMVKEGRVQFGPDMYKQAVNMVAADHMDELIEARVEATLKKPSKPSNVSPSSSAGAKKPTKIRISEPVKRRLEEEAKQLGVPLEKHVAYVKRKHPERLKGVK